MSTSSSAIALQCNEAQLVDSTEAVAASEIAVSVRNLGKSYRLWNTPQDRLKQPLRSMFARWLPIPHKEYFNEFWALRDINFDVKKGETLGIIGRNGSGKSTLLQILCGTLAPTCGSYETRGRVSALLELGSGFNPEFSGRDNVYMNAAILGLSKEEIDERYESIVEFADIGQFIDQPVKTYSSGMYVRLAFAVAINVDPDILVVDEALSVGDVFFQQKCFQHIREMVHDRTTLLFVTHDMAAMRNLCDRAILLQDGASIFDGPPEETASRYFTQFSGKAEKSLPKKDARNVHCQEENKLQIELLKSQILNNNILHLARSRHGFRGMEIIAASFINERNEYAMSVEMLGTSTIHILFKAHQTFSNPSIGIDLFDRMNNLIFAAGTRQLRMPLAPIVTGEERVVTFNLDMSIQPGEYTFSLACSEESEEASNFGYVQDRYEGLGPINIHTDTSVTLPFYGIARLPMEIVVHGSSHS